MVTNRSIFPWSMCVGAFLLLVRRPSRLLPCSRKLFSWSLGLGLLIARVVPLAGGLIPVGRCEHRSALHVVAPTLVELFERVAILVVTRRFCAGEVAETRIVPPAIPLPKPLHHYAPPLLTVGRAAGGSIIACGPTTISVPLRLAGARRRSGGSALPAGRPTNLGLLLLGPARLPRPARRTAPRILRSS